MTRARHNILGGVNAILPYGSMVANHADNDNSVNAPWTLVPPAGMKVGDLVYVNSSVGSSLRNFTIPVTGGQTWTTVQQRAGSSPEIWTSWCRFNGTWTANPSFSIDGTNVAKSVYLFVYRPPKVGATWAVDQTRIDGFDSGSPSYTVTGITNTHPNNVTTLILNGGQYPTTYTVTGAGWKRIGPNKITNTGPNPRTNSFAYQVQGNNYGATGNASFLMTASGFMFTTILSFYFT